MSLSFRFGIISDPHIALPHTISENPYRFHMSEVSIPAFEVALARLEALNPDFLLLPGDLTQHGEPDNHAWLVQRLARVSCPVYVVPGNHDMPQAEAGEQAIAAADFPHLYQKFGYGGGDRPYYHTEILPGLHLIGLNSNQFDAEGIQIPFGQLDAEQLGWVEATLEQIHTSAAASARPRILVMVHHNILEHFPGQATHSMGRRYMTANATDLLPLLQRAGVQLILTGHLHVQDVTRQQGIYEITTGSLVSYPHPYRLLHYFEDEQGQAHLRIESGRVRSAPGWEDLSTTSREWMGDRSFSFMQKLLTQPPLNLSPERANQLAPDLRYFWAAIAEGDALFDFAHFPAAVRDYLQRFGALNPAGLPEQIDNQTILNLGCVAPQPGFRLLEKSET